MPDRIDVLIGRRIRNRRRLLELTQGDLANCCGLSFQQIQKYECAVTRMSAARLWQLSEALGVGIGYFYEGLLVPALGIEGVRR